MTKIEVIVVLGVAIIVVTLIEVVRNSHLLRSAHDLKDSTKLKSIAQGWFVFARESRGMLPTPGLAKRLPVDGQYIPGRGEEDVTQNTTANLFSLCIMGNYFPPELCISPNEPSMHVKEFASKSYDWSGYEVNSGLLWDPNFKADLHNVSNVSYAHLSIFRKTNRSNWRDTLASNHVLLGNRGPLGGVPDPHSITNEIHPPKDSWTGNIAFGDGHVEFLRVFPTVARPNDLSYIIAPEGIPKSGVIPATDAAITFTKEMTADGPVIQHD